MVVERKMIHDIVELIPETEIVKIYAILNAYMSFDNEDVLTEREELGMKEGFEQIARGEYITASDYMEKRGLELWKARKQKRYNKNVYLSIRAWIIEEHKLGQAEWKEGFVTYYYNE